MWRRSGILLQASMRHPVVAGTLQTAYAEPAARDQVIQDDEACDAEEQAPVHASTKNKQPLRVAEFSKWRLRMMCVPFLSSNSCSANFVANLT